MSEKVRGCVEQVADHTGFHLWPCRNRALPGKERCGLHDPETREARRKKRGPTRFERECAAREKQAADLAALRERVRDLEALARLAGEAREMIGKGLRGDAAAAWCDSYDAATRREE